MKITLIYAMSVNGKTTNNNNEPPYKWTSPDDRIILRHLVNEHSLLVFGRSTYESYRGHMRLQPERLRVVMTRTPEKYDSETVPNQLEFINASPEELVKQMEKRGYNKMLLLTGETLTSLFIKAGLVDEIYFTVEPLLFGRGNLIVSETDGINLKLKLISQKQLNEQGTLLLHYKVLQ